TPMEFTTNVLLIKSHALILAVLDRTQAAQFWRDMQESSTDREDVEQHRPSHSSTPPAPATLHGSAASLSSSRPAVPLPTSLRLPSMPRTPRQGLLANAGEA